MSVYKLQEKRDPAEFFKMYLKEKCQLVRTTRFQLRPVTGGVNSNYLPPAHTFSIAVLKTTR